MKARGKRATLLLVGAILSTLLARPALAAEVLTPEEAGARMHELGILHGNDSGDLMLDKGLTRAELATNLARLDDPIGEFSAHPQSFAYLCSFTDVPDWAKSPVGYSWNRGLVKGYGNGLFGAADMVTPDAACTVILRLYGHKASEGDIWSYDTAGAYAVSLGLLPVDAIQGTVISRGNMAVLICNAMGGKADIPIQETITTAATTDYSQQANPAIFQGDLSRENYNAIRDTILHRYEIADGSYQPVPMGEFSRNGIIDVVTAAIGGYPVYEPISQPGGGYVCTARCPESHKDAIEHTKDFLDGLSGMSDSEKVTAMAWYVADRITYAVKYPTPSEVLAQDGQLPGACMSYAYSFRFLCDLAGIPCILTQNQEHQWNQVYVDGLWRDVDVTGIDVEDVEIDRSWIQVLLPLTDVQGSGKTDGDPAVTAFAKELLVPSSTK